MESIRGAFRLQRLSGHVPVDVIGQFWRLGTGAEYETSRRTIGRDDSYPVLGRSEP